MKVHTDMLRTRASANSIGAGPKPVDGGRPVVRWTVGILFLVAVAACFCKPMINLAHHAVDSQLDSYVVLIPFIVAYLIHTRWKELPRHYTVSPISAVIALGIGTCAASFARYGDHRGISSHDYLSLMAFSCVCWILAGGFLFLGRNWMLAALFPVAFLFFAAPLPDRLVDRLETASRLASCDAASVFFMLSGTPVLRDANVFSLPGMTIQVAQECSGIHSSLVLFITSLIAANLMLQTSWRRLFLVAFVIPLGILRNGFRILVIGLLCVHVSPDMINSPIHHKGGPLFFVLSLIPFFLVLWWLRKGEASCAGPRPTTGAGSVLTLPVSSDSGQASPQSQIHV